MTIAVFYSIPGISNKTININMKKVEGGLHHIMVVKATTPGSQIGQASHNFLVNLPPFGGSCTVSPFEGNTFDIICSTGMNFSVFQLTI